MFGELLGRAGRVQNCCFLWCRLNLRDCSASWCGCEKVLRQTSSAAGFIIVATRSFVSPQFKMLDFGD